MKQVIAARWVHVPWWLVVVLLAGCAIDAPPVADDDVRPPDLVARDDDLGSCRADVEQSALTLRVFRSGPLARLGHNHVIEAPLEGAFRLRRDGRGEGWVRLEPAVWRIDRPALRADAGAGFESVPSAADIAATRANMLSPALLAADIFPSVQVGLRWQLSKGQRASPLLAIGATVDAVADLRLVGRTTRVAVPVQIVRQDDGFLATGAVTLSHAELGLRPFSVLGGAIQVADQIESALRLVCTGGP